MPRIRPATLLIPSILGELQAQDVRWIHVLMGELASSLETHGACELVLEGACRKANAPLRWGDCNDDGVAKLADAVCTLNWLFTGAARSVCLSATNTNGDQQTDLSDTVHLLSFPFLGGSSPASPFSACGLGTRPPDAVSGCATFTSCGEPGVRA